MSISSRPYRIPSDPAGMDDRAIDADGGEWTDQRAISIEIDPFNDRFRSRNTPDDVPAVRGE